MIFLLKDPISGKIYEYYIRKFSEFTFRIYREGQQVAKIININNNLIPDIWNRNRYTKYLLIDEIAAYRSITLIKEGKV